MAALPEPNSYEEGLLDIEELYWNFVMWLAGDTQQSLPSGEPWFTDTTGVGHHGNHQAHVYGATAAFATYPAASAATIFFGSHSAQGSHGGISQWGGSMHEGSGSTYFPQARYFHGDGSTGSDGGVATATFFAPRVHTVTAFKPSAAISNASSGQVELQETEISVLADNLAHKLGLQDSTPSPAEVATNSAIALLHNLGQKLGPEDSTPSPVQTPPSPVKDTVGRRLYIFPPSLLSPWTCDGKHRVQVTAVDAPSPTTDSAITQLRDGNLAEARQAIRHVQGAVRDAHTTTNHNAAHHIQALVAFVREMDGEKTALSIWALGLLASNDNAPAMRNADAIPVLVDVLRHGDSRQKKLATWALARLATNKTNSSAIRDAGGIAALMELVDHADKTQQMFATRALAQLAMNKHNFRTIRDAGGLRSLVAGVDAFDDGWCILALGRLAMRHLNWSAMRDAGAIARLMTPVPQRDPTVVLAEHLNSGESSARDRGVEAFEMLLWAGDRQQKQLATKVLVRIAYISGRTSQELREERGLEAVVALVREGTAEDQLISTVVLDRIVNSAEGQDLMIKLRKTDAIGVLVAYVCQGDSEDTIAAESILTELVRDRATWYSFFEAGAITRLAKLINSGDKRQKKFAVDILKKLYDSSWLPQMSDAGPMGTTAVAAAVVGVMSKLGSLFANKERNAVLHAPHEDYNVASASATNTTRSPSLAHGFQGTGDVAAM